MHPSCKHYFRGRFPRKARGLKILVSAVRFRPQPDSVSFLRNAPFASKIAKVWKPRKWKKRQVSAMPVRFGEPPKPAREGAGSPNNF